MDLRLTKNTKILMLVMTWTEFEKEGLLSDPVRVYALAPGFRYWRDRLSIDVGIAGIYAEVNENTTIPPVLPMFTLRYRL